MAEAQARLASRSSSGHASRKGDGGEHEARNSLLVRRDIHSLFNAGYVAVALDLRFEVSRCNKEEFDDGWHYYELHGKSIFAPDDIS